MLRFRRINLIKALVFLFSFAFLINIFWQSKARNRLTNDNEEIRLDKLEIKPIEEEKPRLENYSDKSKYIQEISKERIHRLFDILHHKELNYSPILESLNLALFNSFIEKKSSVEAFKYFKQEVNDFLTVFDNRVRVTDNFIRYLYNKSDEYSFRTPRINVLKAKILKSEEKPVIVTAANAAYYDALQATVFHVHKHFPDYKLIVYDLGLDIEAHKTVINFIFTKNWCEIFH